MLDGASLARSALRIKRGGGRRGCVWKVWDRHIERISHLEGPCRRGGSRRDPGGLAALGPVRRGGRPVETSIFAVQGVDVDVTIDGCHPAKNQALMDVQVKAFFQLVERLGSPELAAELQQKLKPEDIAPYPALAVDREGNLRARPLHRHASPCASCRRRCRSSSRTTASACPPSRPTRCW